MAPGEVYYNENDPGAADWLEWLVAKRLIPRGWVDRRSIADVQPGDLAGFTQHHFFAGIGGWALACQLAGIPTDWPLWTASCPCQPFSAAGRREGADDPRHLWPHLFRLLDACRPARCVGEQVAGKAGYGWFDGVATDLGGAGYASRAVDIPAAAVDSPTIRQRLYWAAVRLLADSPSLGGGRGLEQPLGGPQERAAPAGDDAREHAGRVALDGAEDLGLPPAGREPVQRSGAAQSQRPDGCADRSPLGGAEGWGLALGQLPGWSGRLEGGWGDAPRANDRGRNGSWWAGADWITCHDGKARRVADALAPLLVTRFPGRVVAWRGIGNAIVPPLACEVLAALFETEG